jgi:hypothetical protein
MLMLGIAWLFVTLYASSTGIFAHGSDCPQDGKRPGNYSRASVYLCFQDVDRDLRHLAIPSPDGSRLLIIDGTEASLRVGTAEPRRLFLAGRDDEIIWSQDSAGILITYSLGAAGPVKTDVVLLGERIAWLPDPTNLIRADFQSRHPEKVCRDIANVAGLTWLEGSRKAVLVAEIPTSGACHPDGGYFDAYVVSVPQGVILERYDMKHAANTWGTVLGAFLTGEPRLRREPRREKP